MITHVWRTSLVSLFCAVGLGAAGCSRQGAAAPDVMPSLMLPSSQLTASATQALAGSFTITTTSKRDEIVGRFIGTSSADAAGRETFSLEMTVSGGSGAFASSAGILVGEGKGATTSIGSFSLKITGTITFPFTPGASVNLKMSSRGTTSCENQVLLMRGDGGLPMFGRADVVLTPDSVSVACP